MFTGIIEAVGKVLSSSQMAGDVRLVIDAAGLDMGDRAGEQLEGGQRRDRPIGLQREIRQLRRAVAADALADEAP